MDPLWCRVKGLFVPRGGTRIDIFAEHFKKMPSEDDANIKYAVNAWKMEQR